MAGAAGEVHRLNVFISYSRRDKEIADGLVDRLEEAGINAVIDRRDLPYGEEFQVELAEFIRSADTVLWLVSPESVRSSWCNWELGEVARLKKRLVPVLVRETGLDALPEAIGKIHLLPAEGVFSPEVHFSILLETLNTDRAWLKEHTRLADRARQWMTKDRPSAMLLRGPALKDAEVWTDHQPRSSPPPSEEILELILSSRRAATRRQRGAAIGAIAAACFAFGLAALAYWQRDIALREEEKARASAQAAVASQAAERVAREAEAASRKLAETNEQLARQQQQLAESRAVDARLRAQAAEARVLLTADTYAGLRRSADTMKENLATGRDVIPEVYASLFSMLHAGRKVREIRPPPAVSFMNIFSLAASPDDKLIAVGTVNLVHILGRDGREVAPPIAAPTGRHINANQVAWDEPGELLAVASGTMLRGQPQNAALRLYDRQGRLVRTLVDNHPVPIRSVAFVPTMKIVLAGDDDGGVIRVDLETGDLRTMPSGRSGALHGIAIVDEGLSLAIGPIRSESRDPQSDAGRQKELQEKSATDSPLVRFVDVPSIGRVDSVPDSAASGLLCVSRSQSSGRVATCGADGNVNMWRAPDRDESYRLDHSMRGHLGPVYAVAHHPTADIVATGGADGEIRVWSTAGTMLGPPLRAHLGVSSGVRALLFVDGGKELWSAGSDGRIVVWDTADLDGAKRDLDFFPRLAVLTGNNHRVVAADDNTWEMSRIDAASGRSVLHKSSPGPIVDLAVDQSGETVAFSVRNTVTVSGGRDGVERSTHVVSSRYAMRLAFGPNGQVLAVAAGPTAGRSFTDSDAGPKDAGEPSLTFLEAASGRVVARAPSPHGGDVLALAGNPSARGPAFASAASDGFVRFWSGDGAPIGAPTRFQDRIEKIGVIRSAFSKRGSSLAIAWADQIWSATESYYCVFDAEKRQPLTAPQRVQGIVDAVAFHPELDMVAIAARTRDANSIHLHTARGELLGTIVISASRDVVALNFDDSGTTLTVIDQSGDLRQWVLSPERLMDMASKRYEREEVPGRIARLLEAASAASGKNDWKTATQILEQARDIDPGNALVRRRLGNAYNGPSPEERAKARPEYDRAIDLAPYAPASYLWRGQSRHWAGDPAGAIDDFTQALRYGYLYLRAPPVIAHFIAAAHTAEASTWLSNAYAMLAFHHIRGRSYVANRNWAEAEADLTLTLQGSPQLRDALSYMLLAAKATKHDAAIAELTKELAASRGIVTPVSYELRAQARVGLKNFDGAIADLRAAIELMRDPAQAYAHPDFDERQTTDPAERARKRATLLGRLAESHNLRGDRDAAKQARAQAVTELDDAHKLAPKNAWILIERGRAKLDAGLPRDAVLADYVAAADLDTSNTLPAEWLLQILIWYRDYARTETEAARLLGKISRPSPGLRLRAAIAAWQLGRKEEASNAIVALKNEVGDLVVASARAGVALWENERELLRNIENAPADAPNPPGTRP